MLFQETFDKDCLYIEKLVAPNHRGFNQSQIKISSVMTESFIEPLHLSVCNMFWICSPKSQNNLKTLTSIKCVLHDHRL